MEFCFGGAFIGLMLLLILSVGRAKLIGIDTKNKRIY